MLRESAHRFARDEGLAYSGGSLEQNTRRLCPKFLDNLWGWVSAESLIL
ncbi:MAG: hypothetical protein ACYCV6_01110 [Steroidobacteraceae bacterium]